MIADEKQIERIVRQVLDRVGQLDVGDVAPANSSGSPGELVLTASVVTLDTLDRGLDGIQRVVVTKTAVVTPAARDALADCGIKLSRCDSAARSSATQHTTRPTIVAATDSESLDRLVNALQQDASGVETLAVGSLTETMVELCRAVESQQAVGMFLTDQAAAAVCLANRHRHIRAIHALDASTARDAAESIGANLFVIDPHGASDFQIKRIAQTAQQATPAVRCRDLKRALEQVR